MPLTDTNIDELASALFTEMLDGVSFEPPVVDLSSAEYQVPSAVGNPLYDPVGTLTEGDLTSRAKDGTGMFDGIMQSIGAHLRSEFDKGRITGKEYAEAWTSAMSAGLGSAVQYLLQKDNARYQAMLVQIQARNLEIQSVGERVRLEIEKARLQTTLVEAHTAAANYAMMKLKLANEAQQFAMSELTVQKLNYEITNLLPAQLAQANKSLEATTAEIAATAAKTAQTVYETSDILPTQKLGLEAEVAVKEYNIAFMLPAQVLQLTKQNAKLDFEIDELLPNELIKSSKEIEVRTAEISSIVAKKDQILYETASVLPAQVEGLEKDNAIKTYQLSDRLPAEVAGITADTVGKVYSNEYLLPAQLTSIREQSESHRAKTLDTRSDGTVVAGSTGMQNRLQEEQINSYKRDAETKIVKMLLDTWVTQKSLDEGLAPPSSLTDASINSAMATIRTNTGL